MSKEPQEKAISGASSSASTSPADRNKKAVFYDPWKESIWTRLGLSLESFKRAPGSTGYVEFFWPVEFRIIIKISLCPNFKSQQIVAGDLSGEDLEKVRQQGPMLQAEMKPRHLTMIAVGMNFNFFLTFSS
jgi:yeast amino acid transporter